MARENSEISADQLKNDPRFQRTRENMAEFKKAGIVLLLPTPKKKKHIHITKSNKIILFTVKQLRNKSINTPSVVSPPLFYTISFSVIVVRISFVKLLSFAIRLACCSRVFSKTLRTKRPFPNDLSLVE